MKEKKRETRSVKVSLCLTLRHFCRVCVLKNHEYVHRMKINETIVE